MNERRPTTRPLRLVLAALAAALLVASCATQRDEQSTASAPAPAKPPSPAARPAEADGDVTVVHDAAPGDADAEQLYWSSGSFIANREGADSPPSEDRAREDALARLRAERQLYVPTEAVRAAQERAAAEAARSHRKPSSGRKTPRTLGKVVTRDPFRADDEREAQGHAASVDLSGYDEVWVIARRSADAPAARDPEERSLVGLIAKGRDGADLPFPLTRTDVSADVDGVVQSVLVTQTYENPYDAILEATYVFPLPHDGAVCDFVMTIGARRIRGIVRDREEAERVYSEAQAEGHVASLLTQERPNVFTQRVANLEPGTSIDVELRYFGLVAQRDGWFELVVPTVVGPRYNPAGRRDGVGAVARGDGGASGQRTEVQYLAPGERTSHELALAVDLDAGAALEEVLCRTHRIESEWLAPGRRILRLANGDTAADRDFVLRWRVAGREVKTAFLQHVDGDERWFSLVLHPPADLADVPRAPMEMVFVVDCSGSMSGEPLRACKRAARRVMERLTPRDRFQVVQFSATASLLGKEPIAATRENVRLGTDYLDSLESEGGTEMIHGIRAALDFRRDPERQRVVTFMTDGFIGNESEILGEIAARLGDTRIFSFGAGTSVNRHLLESMARMGRGAVAYVGPDGGASDAEVDAFYERISHPAIADVQIDWGMTVSDVFPSRVPDLFVGRPVVLTGRIEGRVAREVTVRGTVGGEPASYRVEIPDDDESSRPALPKIWARAKIEQLEELALSRGEDMTPQVRAVAVEHGLMSRVTAFVAVDSLTRVGTGPTVAVAQPVPMPAGVSHATTLRR